MVLNTPFLKDNVPTTLPPTIDAFELDRKKTAEAWVSVITMTSSDVPLYFSRCLIVYFQLRSNQPDMLLMHEGKLCDAFLLRAAVIDCNRMVDTFTSEEYFGQRVIVPEYDRYGNRSNMPEHLLQAKKQKSMEKLSGLMKTHRDLTTAGGIGGAGGGMKSSELTQKRYFSREEMDLQAYGALLGARGSVHQELEKTTRCKIVLAGRGITDSKIDLSATALQLALEEPHVRVTAPNEKALQAAMERIEWILSDDPEAVQFRENNRKKMAKIDGRYNAETWGQPRGGAGPAHGSSSGQQQQSSGYGGGDGRKRGREEPRAEELDADVKDFLEAF